MSPDAPTGQRIREVYDDVMMRGWICLFTLIAVSCSDDIGTERPEGRAKRPTHTEAVPTASGLEMFVLAKSVPVRLPTFPGDSVAGAWLLVPKGARLPRGGEVYCLDGTRVKVEENETLETPCIDAARTHRGRLVHRARGGAFRTFLAEVPHESDAPSETRLLSSQHRFRWERGPEQDYELEFEAREVDFKVSRIPVKGTEFSYPQSSSPLPVGVPIALTVVEVESGNESTSVFRLATPQDHRVIQAKIGKLAKRVLDPKLREYLTALALAREHYDYAALDRLDRDSTSAATLLLRGTLLMRLGRFDEAVSVLVRAKAIAERDGLELDASLIDERLEELQDR